MGSTNHGTQNITFQYNLAAKGDTFDKLLHNIIPRGLYLGGHLKVVSDTAITLTPLAVQLGDANFQVTVQTAVNAPISGATLNGGTIDPATPVVVLRWTLAEDPVNYMEVHAIASAGVAQSNDVILGTCVFSGSTLTGFDYTDRQEARTMNNWLKPEATEDTELFVYVRAGNVHAATGNVNIATQKVGPFVAPPAPNSRIDLVYVNTTGVLAIDQGTAATSPTVPEYAGKLVLAEVLVANGVTDISASVITDVRQFVAYPILPDLTILPPRWSVSIANDNSFTTPSQFSSPIATYSLESLGSIQLTSDDANYYMRDNSTLFQMTVNSVGIQTKTLKMFVGDNEVNIYINSILVFSRPTVYRDSSAPLSIPLNLINGENLIEVVQRDFGAPGSLCLIGDIIDNTLVKFVQP